MPSTSDKRLSGLWGLRITKRRLITAGIVTSLFVISLFVQYTIFLTNAKAGSFDLFTPGGGIKSSSIIPATPSAPLT